ncbi:hypothetical protein BUALT_Bualt04G0051200 [Buddleja alternifolia]|uniref:TF-B3 domain-containing protein n=1 Tax=Buddleja alternifolia TaxID=168488 RepID=A0AAV6XMT6_9LAMI|nr:hypothetical protein BUALT_Bualt04G0051200 [Buddleja alternifolia]
MPNMAWVNSATLYGVALNMAWRIPKGFTQKYGQNVANSIFLKVASGLVWKVELIRCNGETWMQKGWIEFKEYYSLGYGHFLVFEYDGDSSFNVLIFDMSGTEIEYPSHANIDRAKNNNRAVPEENIGSESDDDSVIFLDEYLPTNDKGKGRNVQEIDQEEDDVSLEILDNPTPRHQQRRKRTIADDHSSKRCSRRESPKSVDKKTCLTYQMAMVFMSYKKSRSPFFISLMQPSYVSHNFNLNIPLYFAKENLPKEKRNSLILSVSKAKKWCVRCDIGTGNAKILVGWKNFVRDNKLKVGDACVFEVAKTAKPEWNVIIFRS